jgi:lipopolysaccharide transport system ATP-binding protein
VKRYSSGMYVRLAFAVAAHLEPEILIVDEVLAVGDAIFQEKCLGKMKAASRSEGRTVLFVSHNMGALQSLCSRAVLLSLGRITFEGKVQDAVSYYMRAHEPKAMVDSFDGCARQGTGEARIVNVRFEDDQSNPQTHFRMGEPLNIVVRAHFSTEIYNPIFGVNILTDTGIAVADCRSSHYSLKVGTIKGTIQYRVRIESLTLYPRNYIVEPWVSDAGCLSELDWIRNAARFVVTSGPKFLSGANVSANHGISFIPTSWAMSKV